MQLGSKSAGAVKTDFHIPQTRTKQQTDRQTSIHHKQEMNNTDGCRYIIGQSWKYR